MNKSILLFIFTLITALVSAQTVKSRNASADDYIKLLNGAGYNAYCFTIPQEFVGSWASFTIKEYNGGQEVKESFMAQIFDGFSFSADSPEIMIGILPEQKGDSARMISMNWGASVSMLFPYTFKITDDTDFDTGGTREPYYFYSMVGNEEEISVVKNEFVPLCLFGSAYKIVQDDYTNYKFCGSFKDLAESSPHYYLIGITIH